MRTKTLRLFAPVTLALGLSLGGCGDASFKDCEDGVRVPADLECPAAISLGKLLSEWQAGDLGLSLREAGQITLYEGKRFNGTFELIGRDLSIEYVISYDAKKEEKISSRRTASFLLGKDGQSLAWPALFPAAGAPHQGIVGEWTAQITREKLKNGEVDLKAELPTSKETIRYTFTADGAVTYRDELDGAVMEERGTYAAVAGEPGWYLLALSAPPVGEVPGEPHDVRVQLLDDTAIGQVIYTRKQ